MNFNKVTYLIVLSFVSNLLFSQISFNNTAAQHNISIIGGTFGWNGGVSFYDFNQDGFDDITFSSNQGDSLLFYINNGCSFTKSTSVVENVNDVNQINWVDIDNDGDKDLFLTTLFHGLRLYLNQGGLSFTDISNTCGIELANISSYGSTFGDFDKDGDLDIYISTLRQNDTVSNILYRNNGNNTFTDITLGAGLFDTTSFSYASVFWDYDKDGWMDIFSTTDKKNQFPNTLYKNNGNGTFSDVSLASNTFHYMDAMSTTVDDYNNDGWLDMYITNTNVGNFLLHNNGNGTFTDTAMGSGVSLQLQSWGAAFFDAENDGDMDLYVNTVSNPTKVPSAFFENMGSGMFSQPTTTGMNNETAESYGNAIGDYNNDGLVDVVVMNFNEAPFLWENTSTGGNYIKIFLEGTVSNRDAIGSFIYVYTNGQQQLRYTLCGEGFLGQFSQYEIIGVGSANTVDSIVVDWLSGIKSVLYNVPVNQTVKIIEGPNNPANLSIGVLDFQNNCPGDSIRLKALNHFDHYLWNTGDTTSSIFVDSSGSYTLTATSGGQASFVQVDLVFQSIPALNLGNDTVICDGELIRLNSSITDGCNYWSDASDKNYLNVSSSGVYWVEANKLGCQLSDTINVSVHLEKEVSLGNDTSICAGDTLILDAGDNWSEYLWSDNSTKSTLAVWQSGVYYVDVIDSNNCQVSDNISVYVSPCLLVPEIEKEAQLIVYPNPGRNKIYMKLTDDSEFFLEVTFFSLNGEVKTQIWMAEEKNELMLDVSDLPSGQYILHVKSNRNQHRKPLIIVN